MMKRYTVYNSGCYNGCDISEADDGEWYDKKEVDQRIAELEAENERLYNCNYVTAHDWWHLREIVDAIKVEMGFEDHDDCDLFDHFKSARVSDDILKDLLEYYWSGDIDIDESAYKAEAIISMREEKTDDRRRSY